MKLLFVMDPMARLQIAGDSTFAIMLAAQARNHEIWFCEPRHLSLEHADAVARAWPVTVRRIAGDHYLLGPQAVVPLLGYWFGFDFESRVIVCVLVSLFPLITNTLHGLKSVDPAHHDLFTWALTHFTQWSPDIVQDLDGFIAADPGDRLSRLAVAELLAGHKAVSQLSYPGLKSFPQYDLAKRQMSAPGGLIGALRATPAPW